MYSLNFSVFNMDIANLFTGLCICINIVHKHLSFICLFERRLATLLQSCIFEAERASSDGHWWQVKENVSINFETKFLNATWSYHPHKHTNYNLEYLFINETDHYWTMGKLSSTCLWTLQNWQLFFFWKTVCLSLQFFRTADS